MISRPKRVSEEPCLNMRGCRCSASAGRSVDCFDRTPGLRLTEEVLSVLDFGCGDGRYLKPGPEKPLRKLSAGDCRALKSQAVSSICKGVRYMAVLLTCKDGLSLLTLPPPPERQCAFRRSQFAFVCMARSLCWEGVRASQAKGD